MILSMTGFGKASVVYKNKKITAEIKSLNSKQLDFAIRLPQQYREIELVHHRRGEYPLAELRLSPDIEDMVAEAYGRERHDGGNEQ